MMDIRYQSEGHKRFIRWWRQKGWTVRQLAQAMVLDELCVRRIIQGSMEPSLPSQCRIHELSKNDSQGPIEPSHWRIEPKRYSRKKGTAA